MSLVDDVFSSLPGPLIDQWGITGTYVKQAESPAYDPETGTLSCSSGSATEIQIRLLPTRLQPNEVGGEIQLTDVKLLIAGTELGDYYPKTSDWVKYNQAGVQRVAKIITPITSRGSKPVLHSVIARLT